MAALIRYFLPMGSTSPAKNLLVLPIGAYVDSDQTRVSTVVVQEGHGFEVGHKFLYCPNRRNVQTVRPFTVTGVTTLTISFSGGVFSFPGGSLLVNLGPDTGGILQDNGTYSPFNYDGSTVTVHKTYDSLGDAWLSSLVEVEPPGEVGFYGDGSTFWGLSLAAGPIPNRVYPDLNAGGGGSSGTLAITMSAGDVVGVDGIPAIHYKTAVSGTTVQIWAPYGDGTWAAFDLLQTPDVP